MPNCAISSSISVRKVGATFYMLLGDEVGPVLDPISLPLVLHAIVSNGRLPTLRQLYVRYTCQPATSTLALKVLVSVPGYVSLSAILSSRCLILH